MSDLFHTERIEVDGFGFLVNYYFDQDSKLPWSQCDGHGPVRNSHQHNYRRLTKRPGERPMRSDKYTYLYDWQEAMQIAKRDGWGPGTPAEAVQADFEFLRAWVRDEWWYCGVEVELRLHPQYNDSLWGVGTYKDYHLESAKEQAREVLCEYLDDIESGKLRKEE